MTITALCQATTQPIKTKISSVTHANNITSPLKFHEDWMRGYVPLPHIGEAVNYVVFDCFSQARI